EPAPSPYLHSFPTRRSSDLAAVFFGKDLRDLTLAEAATIAGLIQSPSHYSPLHDPDAARARRNLVLAAMQENGAITNEQKETARSEEHTSELQSLTNLVCRL